MNNKALVLLALSFLFSGCTQVNNLPAESSAAGNDSATTVSGTSQPAEISAQEVLISEGEDEEQSLNSLETGQSAEVSNITLEIEPQFSEAETQQRGVLDLCQEIGNKLGSVTVEDCLAQSLGFGGAYTVQSRPIAIRDFLAEDNEKESPRILIIGGLHGDEYSSISIMFRWMEQLEASNNRDFNWRFAPTVNPDGLLDGQAVRQNANGVDLNRNFPSDDWEDLAQDYWANTTNRNPRRFPGSYPASEPEVQWVVEQINTFKPDVIVSVHAPYHLLDYDGPPEPPEKIGELHLHLLGVYPGSLGNFAGVNLGIPVVTMELPSAGIMPADDQIEKMWKDLMAWLYENHDT